MTLVHQRIFEFVEPRLGIADRSVLLAISGPSCSGKTTLGEQLAEYAAELGYDAPVIHADAYLRPEIEHPRRSPEHVGYYEDAFDYSGLLREVQRMSSGVSCPDLLIVEGEFVLRREYREVWDASVWIEIDDELALERGVDRDATFFGSKEAARRIYLDRCLPANWLHRQRDDPAGYADLVLFAADDGGLTVRA